MQWGGRVAGIRMSRPSLSCGLGRLFPVLALLALAGSAVVVGSAPAGAAESIYQVAGTGGQGTFTHPSGPRFSRADLGTLLPEGTQLDIRCRMQGDTGTAMIYGKPRAWNWWNLLADGSYVFDGHTNVDPQGGTIPLCADIPAADDGWPTCDSASGDAARSCDDRDPEVTRCVRFGLVLLASAPIGDPDGGVLQLWYSRTCRAGWIRAIWPQSPQFFTSSRTDAWVSFQVASDAQPFPITATAEETKLLWTPMVSAQRGECIYGSAIVHAADGASYPSPELRDCS
jgi:Protein of unknown function (DUF2690)